MGAGAENDLSGVQASTPSEAKILRYGLQRIHVVQVHLHASPEYAWCVRLCCESAGGNGDMQKEAVEN